MNVLRNTGSPPQLLVTFLTHSLPVMFYENKDPILGKYLADIFSIYFPEMLMVQL